MTEKAINLETPKYVEAIKFLKEIEESSGANLRNSKDAACVDWSDAVAEFLTDGYKDQELDYDFLTKWHQHFGRVWKYRVNRNGFNQNWFVVEFKVEDQVRNLVWTPEESGRFEFLDKITDSRYLRHHHDYDDRLEVTPGKRSELDD